MFNAIVGFYTDEDECRFQASVRKELSLQPQLESAMERAASAAIKIGRSHESLSALDCLREAYWLAAWNAARGVYNAAPFMRLHEFLTQRRAAWDAREMFTG
ncbi:hypothetical protein [Burkholderia territorii]|uniref:hypothetical protein n=1 Tax=Burkholderia territorii TaxID=1503055 RepID=UPI0018C582D8|nr:hypothetical protein [Burkholderia territorii]